MCKPWLGNCTPSLLLAHTSTEDRILYTVGSEPLVTLSYGVAMVFTGLAGLQISCWPILLILMRIR